MKPAHSLSYKETFTLLKTGQGGLSELEAKERLVQYGLNKIKEKEKISPLKIFAEQFQGFLVYLLFGAGILSILIKEYIDGGAIFVILLLNGILGFVQEFKAEKAMEALKKLETPKAKICRGGIDMVVQAEELVPGDILYLGEGDKVPADARLIEAFYLQVDESILTGESRPVTKHTDAVEVKTSLPDRKNSVFSGTMVIKGRAKAVIFATAMNTELGKIATLVSEAEEVETPLQQTLEHLGKILGTICVVVALPGLILGLIRGHEWVEMVMTAVSLAVSAIPEGLPVVVTIALALGTRRMVKRGVLIRKLASVEALGSTDIICSDKTGTITLNKMTATEFFTPKLGNITVTGKGIVADFSKNGKKVDQNKLHHREDVELLLKASILCNDSDLNFGDPTERALLVLGEQLGISTEETDKACKRLDEVPFDSANKYMITVNNVKGKKLAFIKGAPEVVLKGCSLPASEKTKLLKMIEGMSGRALRVLAFGYRDVTKGDGHKKLEKYHFLGLVGMIDPPRAEVKPAIVDCYRAGIRVLMLTGDHPLTAAAIAKEVGIKFNKVLTGLEVDAMTPEELQHVVEKESVFARVSPENKLNILRSLQKNKHLVAMTGDGVNDTPALKEANIGIAVGSGSDLAKEVSDMVLLDDNFATIAKAVAEGRGIFFNIKKFVKFLIAANFDEILAILTSIITGIPLPFLPIHLLWLNLATDSLPAMALSVDKYEDGLMQKKPYDPKKEILHGVITFSVIAGILAYLASMGSFIYELKWLGASERMAQTMTFTVTVLFEFFIVFSCRSDKSAFSIGLFSNKFLLGAIGFGLIMQLFALYFPYTHEVFKTAVLGLDKWPIVMTFAASGFLIIEIFRAIRWRGLALK